MSNPQITAANKIAATDTGSYGSITVGTTPTQLAPSQATRISVTFQNNSGTKDIYVGYDDQVTVATGLKVKAGAQYEEGEYTGVIYAVTSTGTVDVRKLLVGA